ncbi:unnamed protein product, partial [Ixodes pacificus]
ADEPVTDADRALGCPTAARDITLSGPVLPHRKGTVLWLRRVLRGPGLRAHVRGRAEQERLLRQLPGVARRRGAQDPATRAPGAPQQGRCRDAVPMTGRNPLVPPWAPCACTCHLSVWKRMNMCLL